MPSLGDFFRVDAAPGFIPVWDVWLQGAMSLARDVLGERWLDCYMSAPIWRFSLAGGLAGPDPVTGVMMPSIDRVGRQFPLTLMAPADPPGSLLQHHLESDALFGRLEAVALGALDDGATRDGLVAALAALETAPADEDGAPDGQVVDTGAALVVSGYRTARFLPYVAAEKAYGRHRPGSIWSAEVDDLLWLMTAPELPGDAASVGLFDLDAAIWGGGGP